MKRFVVHRYFHNRVQIIKLFLCQISSQIAMSDFELEREV